MIQKNKKKCLYTESGSFLLELLVAFAIISIAMTVIVDSFVTSQRSYRAITDQTNLTRSLTMVLEDMAREGKVSEKYGCSPMAPSPCNGTSFFMEHIEGLNNQASGEFVEYSISGSQLIKKTTSVMTGAPITPPSIEVTDFDVKIIGVVGVDQVQALITLTAHATNDPNLEVHLQTSFTQRIH